MKNIATLKMENMLHWIKSNSGQYHLPYQLIKHEIKEQRNQEYG